MTSRYDTLSYSLLVLIQHLQTVRQNSQLDSQLKEGLLRSLLYVIYAWMYEFLRFDHCSEPTQAECFDVVTIIFSHFHYQDVVSELLNSFDIDHYILTRLLYLFSHEASVKKDDVFLYLSTTHNVLSKFNSKQLILFLYKAIQLNYSKQSIVDLFSSDSTHDSVSALCLEDMGFVTYLFNQSDLFRFTTRQSFLNLA